MKTYCSFLILFVIFCCVFTTHGQSTYVGSTPPDQVVRKFLSISLTDSIDFIRWKLEIGSGAFKLECQYGLAKAGTPGFTKTNNVIMTGQLTKTGNYYHLQHKDKQILLLEVNANLLHLLDQHKQMLVGNGGYSYALNNTDPVKTNQYKLHAVQSSPRYPLIFEGRTPCQELSVLLGLGKSKACDKLKWYFVFYTDSLTGKPSHYLKAGMGYTKRNMEKGQWEIITKKNGQIIYQLNPADKTYTLYLLKGDENILFFIDRDGRLLVGNENFSYLLNRKREVDSLVQK